MVVPKCKECEDHTEEVRGENYYYGCNHPTKCFTFSVLGTNIKHTIPKNVDAKEYRTSPKWCPLRKSNRKWRVLIYD